MASERNERLTLASSVCCLILVAWLILQPRLEPASMPPPAPVNLDRPLSAAPDQQFEQRLVELTSRIDALREAFDRQSVRREAALTAMPTATEPAVGPVAVRNDELVDLQQEIQALRLAVQSLSEVHSGNGVSHSLHDLRREFPATNWPACASLIQRAKASATSESDWRHAEGSPALAELMMQLPRDVLAQFGSPSRTGLHENYFHWTYRAAERGSGDAPEYGLVVTFLHGYVVGVEVEELER